MTGFRRRAVSLTLTVLDKRTSFTSFPFISGAALPCGFCGCPDTAVVYYIYLNTILIMVLVFLFRFAVFGAPLLADLFLALHFGLVLGGALFFGYLMLPVELFLELVLVFYEAAL